MCSAGKRHRKGRENTGKIPAAWHRRSGKFVLHRTTIDVIPRPHRGRGNLLLGSEVLYYPIHIEHFGYSMLIGAVLKSTAVVEIATGINALAMTMGGAVCSRQSGKLMFIF